MRNMHRSGFVLSLIHCCCCSNGLQYILFVLHGVCFLNMGHKATIRWGVKNMIYFLMLFVVLFQIREIQATNFRNKERQYLKYGVLFGLIEDHF